MVSLYLEKIISISMNFGTYRSYLMWTRTSSLENNATCCASSCLCAQRHHILALTQRSASARDILRLEEGTRIMDASLRAGTLPLVACTALHKYQTAERTYAPGSAVHALLQRLCTQDSWNTHLCATMDTAGALVFVREDSRMGIGYEQHRFRTGLQALPHCSCRGRKHRHWRDIFPPLFFSRLIGSVRNLTTLRACLSSSAAPALRTTANLSILLPGFLCLSLPFSNLSGTSPCLSFSLFVLSLPLRRLFPGPKLTLCLFLLSSSSLCLTLASFLPLLSLERK